MASHCEQRELPYAPRQVFDLVADIERYPEFLPHVRSARVTYRRDNVLFVDQVVHYRFLRLAFSTRAVLQAPTRIEIVCAESSFGSFTELWTFADLAAGGTLLRSVTDFEFRSGLLRRAFAGVFDALHRASVAAFEMRAKEVLGGACRPPQSPSP